MSVYLRYDKDAIIHSASQMEYSVSPSMRMLLLFGVTRNFLFDVGPTVNRLNKWGALRIRVVEMDNARNT